MDVVSITCLNDGRVIGQEGNGQEEVDSIIEADGRYGEFTN